MNELKKLFVVDLGFLEEDIKEIENGIEYEDDYGKIKVKEINGKIYFNGSLIEYDKEDNLIFNNLDDFIEWLKYDGVMYLDY